MKFMILILASISLSACSMDADKTQKTTQAKSATEQTRDYDKEFDEGIAEMQQLTKEMGDKAEDMEKIGIFRDTIEADYKKMKLKDLDNLYDTTLAQMKTNHGKYILAMTQIVALGIIKK